MIRLTVVAVGKLKEPYWRAAAEEYAKRLRPYATLEVVEVADRDISRDAAAARSAEADDVLRALPPSAYTVVLDEGGRECSSTELSEWLDGLTVRGVSHVAFIVGGSAGIDERLREGAKESLSLSRLTFPHQMARVMLLEQLYRAFKIAKREPYHH